MYSIKQTGQDVHAKHLADNTNANNQAGAKSVLGSSDDVSTTSLIQGIPYLAKELKELISLKDLMESDGHEFKHTGRYQMCRCPFHNDRTPSFGIREDSDFKGQCYSCGWWGDILKYEMEFHKVDFTAAWLRLNDFYYRCPRKKLKATNIIKPLRRERVKLTEKQIDERDGYARRLETDRWIAEEVCRKRYEYNGEKWNPDTIQDLAMEGPLGWAGDAIAFMYPTGTKYRKWPEKEFWWDCDELSLWRRHGIYNAHHVYITEGETDAIALLDMGIEKDNPYAWVVAAPSATSFYPEWAEQFEGKKVTVCFDNDEAGQRGSVRVCDLIYPHASELAVMDLGGVL